jgi:hypothetical protein
VGLALDMGMLKGFGPRGAMIVSRR